MNFFDMFLDENDYKISDIDGYNHEYNNLNIKKFNKFLKENDNKEITLFFAIKSEEDIFDFLVKGIKTNNNNQTLILYSNFTSAKIYSGIQTQDRGFIFKIDVKISKLSINKERINEMKIIYPDIGNTLSESIIGASSVKHKGKIYFDKIKSIIYVNNKTNKIEEIYLNVENRQKGIEKIHQILK